MINPLIQQAEYLVLLGGKTTALCPNHAKDFALTSLLIDLEPELYELPGDEEPIVCQTCYLIETNGGEQKTIQ